MTHAKPQWDKKEAARLRGAAIRSLKGAARQSDPRESDRLTRHALDLIARARAIEHGWRCDVSKTGGARGSPDSSYGPSVLRGDHEWERRNMMAIARPLSAEFFGTFWLTFGGCGSAVLAAAFPALGIGFLGVALAFGLRSGDRRVLHAVALRGRADRRICRSGRSGVGTGSFLPDRPAPGPGAFWPKLVREDASVGSEPLGRLRFRRRHDSGHCRDGASDRGSPAARRDVSIADLRSTPAGLSRRRMELLRRLRDGLCRHPWRHLRSNQGCDHARSDWLVLTTNRH
jgi:hypothetical protein